MFGMSAMVDVRRTDNEPKKWFRSSRFFKEDDKWFFYSREGTIEGPFKDLEYAEQRLKEYIKIMKSGFMPEDSELNLEPKLEGKRELTLTPKRS